MKSMVPKIRFKGYTNFWEEKQLNTFVDRAVDNRGYTPQISQNGSYLLIEVACLGNINPDYSKVTKYLNEYTYNNCLRGYIKENDILFSTVGSIGLVSLMDNNEKACIAQNIVGFRAKEENVSNYIYSLLSTVNGKNVANQIVMSAVQPSVKVTQLLKCYYTITDNISEQSKIGSFFNYLDKIIVDIRIKLDKLKEIKKTMLYKMFPQNGKKVPEIRLKGFEGEWEERKLYNIVEKITMGQSPDGYTYSTTPSKYILVQGNADIKNGKVCARVWTTQITKTANAGDIIMSVRAPAGSIGKTDFDVVIGRGVASIKGNDFIYHYLSKLYCENYWMRISEGSTFDSLSKEQIYNALLYIPSLDEQKAIGEYFNRYDNMIKEYSQKITKLKELKKTLLNKMFV